MLRRPQIFLTLVLAVAGCSSAVNPGGGEPAPRSSADTSSGSSGYAGVVTAEAVTDSGLFHVHRIEEKLYYEIPDSVLGLDMLMVSRLAQTQADLSGFTAAGAKVGEQVLRWERRGDRILLRRVSFNNIASDTLDPVLRSVRVNNFEPIIEAFDIETRSDDSLASVIEVTDLFTSDIPAFSGLSQSQRDNFRVRRLDGDRSFIDYARSYPMNVEVRNTLTYEATRPPSDSDAGTISVQLHHTMVLLPLDPMRIRYADSRVGWFSINQIDFSSDEQKAASREIIRRWRLEPSDPEAYARGELVDPVKPIVYYLDPGTPEHWRPYVKQGVEDWQEAFEAAGFSNAIIARDPPSPEEDPGFSPEDIRYSTVRWVTNLTRNATGPSVSDPRTGEILESDIIWYHNHLRSYRNRLMLETGASNPDARSLNMPDRLIGEAMRAVIAHEIGHALGLPHNMVASSAYPVDSLRSATFTNAMGIAPTIMDYARQNYIAQPGDEGVRYIRKIGPYDHYAINWGYRVIDTPTPEDEKPILDRWILERAGDRMYHYTPQNIAIDPRAQTEDLGDDPVRASGYGIANLQRVAPNLVDWTATPGEDYSDLEELYGELLTQWNRYIGHVITVLGGVHETLKSSDQPGPVYEPVDPDRQRAAMEFIAGHVFETPLWLVNQDILSRIEHGGSVERLRRIQVGRLGNLMDPGRMQRITEAAIYRPEGAYTLLEYLDDIRDAVWGDMDSRAAIDPFRRNLQRGYVERVTSLMTEDITVNPSSFLNFTPVTVEQSDIRAFLRGQLGALRDQLVRRANRVNDRETRFHLNDIVARIDRLLDTDD